jgi:protein required for attachment to host cells
MNRKFVIVADAAQAYFAVGEGKRLHRKILELSNHELHTHDPDPKKNGRAIGSLRYYDPRTPIKDVESQAFVKEIVDKLEQLMQEERYEGLILVAVPRILGLIRKKLNPHWRVEQSLALEATHLSLQELEKKIFT